MSLLQFSSVLVKSHLKKYSNDAAERGENLADPKNYVSNIDQLSTAFKL